MISVVVTNGGGHTEGHVIEHRDVFVKVPQRVDEDLEKGTFSRCKFAYQRYTENRNVIVRPPAYFFDLR